MTQAGEITMTVRRVARDIRVLQSLARRRSIVRIRLRPPLMRPFGLAPGGLRSMHPADFTLLRALRPAIAAMRHRADGITPRYETRLTLAVACHFAAQDGDVLPVQIRESRPRPATMLFVNRMMQPGDGTIAAAHPLLPRLAQVVVRPPVTSAAMTQQDTPMAHVLARATGPAPVAMTVRRAAPAAEPGPKPPEEPRRIESPVPDPRAIRAMALAPDVIRAVSDQVVTAIDRRMLARREQFGRN